MHHVQLDRWSRIPSPVHRLDARVKALAAVAILVTQVLAARAPAAASGFYFLLVVSLAVWARLPVLGLLARASLVLPFAGGVAALNLFGGSGERAWSLLAKSYISACTVLLLLATTPLHELLRGLETLGVPRFFLMVAQFIYRYLFVISEQAQHMMAARRCRAPLPRPGSLLASVAGTLAVLFARSYGRSERIHQAMLARGFQGGFALLPPPAVPWGQYFQLAALAAVLAGIHLLLWKL